MDRFSSLLKQIEKEIPGFRIVKRSDSKFLGLLFSLLSALHWIIKVCTFGKVKLSVDYNATFTTTIGKTMYVPDNWDGKSSNARYCTLRHEVVHTRQFRQWPFKFCDHTGLRWINYIIYSLGYTVILPMRWTLRAKFEREAYAETLRAYHEVYGSLFNPTERARLAYWLGDTFSDSRYLFMWNRVEAILWAKKTMDIILKNERRAEKTQSQSPQRPS